MVVDQSGSIRIKRASQQLGLSPSVLRKYEQQGVTPALLRSDTKYRHYSYLDISRINTCRKYRSYGYEVKEAVELMNAASLSALKDSLREKQKQFESELLWKQLVLEEMQGTLHDIEQFQENGSIFSNYYQGAGNLSECIVFGRIAGKNSAAAKAEQPAGDLPIAPYEYTGPMLGENADAGVELNENEFLGTGTGMGGALTAKVTVDNGVISNVEVISHNETAGISDPAFKTLPELIVENNSTEVDAVSGATVTSRAIIEAVNDALAKAGT